MKTKTNNKYIYSRATRTNICLIAIAMVAMMTSCNKQEVEPSLEGQRHKVVVTAKRGGMVSTTDTRTSIAENLDFTWVTGDGIGLFTEENSIVEIFTTNIGGSSNADFNEG